MQRRYLSRLGECDFLSGASFVLDGADDRVEQQAESAFLCGGISVLGFVDHVVKHVYISHLFSAFIKCGRIARGAHIE